MRPLTNRSVGAYLFLATAWWGLASAATAFGQGARLNAPPPAEYAISAATPSPAAAEVDVSPQPGGAQSVPALPRFEPTPVGPAMASGSGYGMSPTESGVFNAIGPTSSPAQDMVQCEREAARLTAEYGRIPDEKERSKVRESLAKVLEKEFDLHQKARSQEIEQIEARVKRLRQPYGQAEPGPQDNRERAP